MILSETDSPFAAPAPHRGRRNEPAYVVEIAKKLAEIRGEAFDGPGGFGVALVANARRVFNLQ